MALKISIDKPGLDELRIRDGFFFALCQNIHLIKAYAHGMTEDEFATLNRRVLNNIINGLEKFYGAHFRNRPWLDVAIRLFFEVHDITLIANGAGRSASRNYELIDWAKRTNAIRKTEKRSPYDRNNDSDPKIVA